MSRTLAMAVETRVVWELATGEDIDTGMSRVVELLRRAFGATRVEWCKPDDDDGLTLFASDGAGGGDVRRFGLGPAGELVARGCRDPGLTSALAGAMPVLRRRCVEERLMRGATQLAQRNEALEEFAALVAHQLKAPLHAALVADDASGEVEQALELVDSLLETPREWRDSPVAAAATCLEQALEDLGAIGVEVTAALTAVLPLPSTSLRVILRNLFRNAVAAGAGHIPVAAVRSDGSWGLLVDDDGAGPTDGANYAAGSGLGLSLCARAARRYGGALELAARPSGGTRATLRLAEAS